MGAESFGGGGGESPEVHTSRDRGRLDSKSFWMTHGIGHVEIGQATEIIHSDSDPAFVEEMGRALSDAEKSPEFASMNKEDLAFVTRDVVEHYPELIRDAIQKLGMSPESVRAFVEAAGLPASKAEEILEHYPREETGGA